MQTKLAVQTKLAARARKLSRQVFASLPFVYRFGALMEILSDEYARHKDALGRSFYAIFYQAGVKGLPPLSDKAMEALKDKRTGGALAADKVPKGLGGRLANSILGMVRSRIPNEADTADFMQDLWEMLEKGRLKVDPKKAQNPKSAESFARGFVDLRLKDYLRKHKRKYEKLPETSMTEAETGGQREMPDLRTVRRNELERILNRMTRAEKQPMVERLRRVDPKRPIWPEQWLVGRAEGYNNTELAEEWGVTQGAVTQWIAKHVPKIQQIVAEHAPWAAVGT